MPACDNELCKHNDLSDGCDVPNGVVLSVIDGGTDAAVECQMFERKEEEDEEGG